MGAPQKARGAGARLLPRRAVGKEAGQNSDYICCTHLELHGCDFPATGAQMLDMVTTDVGRPCWVSIALVQFFCAVALLLLPF